MNLLLTSAGSYNKKILEKFLKLVEKKPENLKIAMITTAADKKENNKWVKIETKDFKKYGLKNINYIDLESNPKANFEKYDIVYVCGGNTFKLMKYIRLSDFEKKIKKFLDRGGWYIGVSAGSIIMGPSIEIANEVDPDPNPENMTDFTGLNLVSEIIHPHYEKEAHEKDLLNFEKKHSCKVTRLTNDEALLYHHASKPEKIL